MPSTGNVIATADPHLCLDEPAPVFEAALGSLRTRILQRMQAVDGHTLGVVSPSPHEGRTLIAAHLARSIAASRERHSVLVDADLRHPAQHRLWGLSPGIGLSQVLAGVSTLDAALVRPGPERLELLPAGAASEESLEWLGSDRMTDLLERLVDKDPSRFVVLDLAPVLGAGDALAVLPAVDAVLMVVDDDRTSVDDLAAAERLLDGLPLIGIALNRSRGAASARMRPRS